MSAEIGYQSLIDRLPDDWSVVPIAALGNIISGSTPSRDVPAYWGGTIPWVTPGELTSLGTKYITNTNETISAKGLGGTGANLLPKGSLLITTRATLGARAINSVPMATNQGFKSITFRKSGDADFYYYWTEKLVPELVRRASGTTFLEISGSQFSQISVPAPPEEERAKIAQILDTLDTQIRQTEVLIAKLERIKQGLLTDLLTRGIDQNGQLCPTPDQAPHLYKDSPLGRIPKEWDIAAIDSLSEMVTSGARDWARFYSDEGAKFIRIGDLTREHINFRFDSLVYVNPPTEGESQRTRLEVGDILISITADLGITAVANESIGEAYINQHIALVRPDARKVNARFLGHFIASAPSQRLINAFNDAGAKAGLNLPTVRKFLVVVPDRWEQDAIQERLDAVDIRIAQEKIELSKLKSKRLGLMDDLLTGRVRVSSLLESPRKAG